jgi:hypothetical protein
MTDLSKKSRMTVEIDEEILESCKNAVYWTPGLTLTKLTEMALTEMVHKMEINFGGKFPLRKEDLKPGRPIESEKVAHPVRFVDEAQFQKHLEESVEENKEILASLAKSSEDQELEEHFLQYIYKKDEYLVKLLFWVSSFEEIKNELRETNRDIELEKDLEEIIQRLTQEIGVRIVMIVP